ncbi:MAG: hypothetical protein J6N74_07465 [Chryseobacterium sp.]|nr:hypothetical protein [Chryseobacterium sp.]
MKTNNQIIFYLLILISILSCERDENPDAGERPQLLSYHYKNMDIPGSALQSNTDGIITIEYNSAGKPTKRNGGLVRLPFAVGFEYTFSKDIYEDINYENNGFTIQRKSISQPEVVYIPQTYFRLENEKIVERVNRDIYYPSANDTIQYYYSGNKLVKSLKKRRRPVSETKYHYNSKGNLDSIVTRDLAYNPTSQQYEPYPQYPKMRTLEIFRDYDNSGNPTKKLMFFDEVFNRSLSQNNYLYYEKKVFDINGNLSQFVKKNWTFSYNSGIIDFSK